MAEQNENEARFYKNKGPEQPSLLSVWSIFFLNPQNHVLWSIYRNHPVEQALVHFLFKVLIVLFYHEIAWCDWSIGRNHPLSTDTVPRWLALR
jgi:hypothetical protein